MNGDHCGKDMPKSYSYEVGGVVDCGCRFKKKKPLHPEHEGHNWHENGFYNLRHHLHMNYEDHTQDEFLWTMDNVLREMDQRIAELEATRVPDELLRFLLYEKRSSEKYRWAYNQAEAILAKRREGKDDT